MTVRPWLVVALMLGLAGPARAQLAVIDPANLAQAIAIADRTLREYQQVVQQYVTLVRMAQRLTDMSAYRTLPIAPSVHQPWRYPFGGPLLEALNTGDPTGARYAQAVSALPAEAFRRLPAPIRATLERQYAALEIADDIAQRAIDQSARVRDAALGISRAVAVLDQDVTDPRDAAHAMTVVLDKVAGAALIARRQDAATNQLLSAAVEQDLLRTKRARDTEAAAMRMRVNDLRDGRAAQGAVIAGTADDLTGWRQP